VFHRTDPWFVGGAESGMDWSHRRTRRRSRSGAVFQTRKRRLFFHIHKYDKTCKAEGRSVSRLVQVPTQRACLKTCNIDNYGQLVTQSAIEKVVKKTGDTKNIRYSAWSSGRQSTSTDRTLEEIVAKPFVNSHYQFELRPRI